MNTLIPCIGLSLLSTIDLVYGVPSPVDPTITPAPLLPRAVDSLVGYYLNNSVSSYEPLYCLGSSGPSTWSTTSTWGYCCPETGVCSQFVTSCSGKFAVRTNGVKVKIIAIRTVGLIATPISCLRLWATRIQLFG
ncbi:uncharacterized protein BDR25DRAFT_15262 [Lindgomyces ingoldianus]|uniref:Uncharacterized protein n=1 Tax=Lindgomyces ingoldianus TaxID=673940 RepID=A0ACB6R285_9PLEO|nr:uncharacterized protein BDR25DRAFT_15262 [Lindgomyces ingoldianus]KAF2472551.1 hypothetical protein BDR25DRAFT_15262 [Lindgomyces ingoldianus]